MIAPTGAGSPRRTTSCTPVDGTLTVGHFTSSSGSPDYAVPDSAVLPTASGTIGSVLPGQVRPTAPPALLDSADGLVHLYFAGPRDAGGGPGPFLVAQHDPVVTRARAAVPWTLPGTTGTFSLVGLRPGTSLNGLTVAVTDCPGQADLCIVTVGYGTASGLPGETWNGVPRDMLATISILSYSYTTSDTPVYGLATAVGSIPLFAASARAVTIQIGAAADGNSAAGAVLRRAERHGGQAARNLHRAHPGLDDRGMGAADGRHAVPRRGVQRGHRAAARRGGAKVSLTQATQQDESYMSSWTQALTDTLGLRCMWEPPQPKDYVNKLVGRRYQPFNLGYALVESLTADLYAHQLRSNGAMVGRIVVPNLAIPPDRNALTFKIDPSYIKNGNLDGKTGLVNDHDYPTADVQRGSYFKPEDAYARAAAIDRADAQLRA